MPLLLLVYENILVEGLPQRDCGIYIYTIYRSGTSNVDSMGHAFSSVFLFWASKRLETS